MIEMNIMNRYLSVTLWLSQNRVWKYVTCGLDGSFAVAVLNEDMLTILIYNCWHRAVPMGK